MKREFHIGPGAAMLILIIVILSMSVLSILALTNARSDARLSARSANVIEAIAKLNEKAEYDLAQLDTVLVQARYESEDDNTYLKKVKEKLDSEIQLNDHTVSWVITDEDERKLYCSVEILPMDSLERYAWKEHRLSNEFAEMELEEIWN